MPTVTTVGAERTFWDKVVIPHGLHRWFERRGELCDGGQRLQNLKGRHKDSSSASAVQCETTAFGGKIVPRRKNLSVRVAVRVFSFRERNNQNIPKA